MHHEAHNTEYYTYHRVLYNNTGGCSKVQVRPDFKTDFCQNWIFPEVTGTSSMVGTRYNIVREVHGTSWKRHHTNSRYGTVQYSTVQCRRTKLYEYSLLVCIIRLETVDESMFHVLLYSSTTSVLDSAIRKEKERNG